MRIAVLGTGRVGSTLGRRWAERSHTVTFGSREPDCSRVRKLLSDADGQLQSAGIRSAVAVSDLVVLAVPWQSAEQIVTQAGNLRGKVLVDCINPLNDRFSDLDLGFTTSASEQIAKWAPDAAVVKAFNTVSAASLADPMYGGQQATMFYCGDDSDAKDDVRTLAEDLQLEAVDAGALSMARYLEPLAMLYIHLAVNQGWGSDCAFKIMKR